jgi:cell division protein FtsB
MSSEEDLKRLFGIVKKAADALQENQKQLAQERIELESIKSQAIEAIRQLNRLPDQITDNVTSAVRQATTQVAPAVLRDLKGHLTSELDMPLASAKVHIANATKIEQRLISALDGFDKRVYQKLGLGVLIVALGALLVMFVALYWERSSLSDIMSQKAQLQAEIPQLEMTVNQLTAHGGKLSTNTCVDSDKDNHLCVLVRTRKDSFPTANPNLWYVIPEGY